MQIRRPFLRRSTMALGGALMVGPGSPPWPRGYEAGFGAPVTDPGGLLDLPVDFHYRVVQTVEDRLTSGAPVPGDFDGIAAFPGRLGSTILVRNHELRPPDLAVRAPVVGRTPYDPAAPGGTTAVVVGPDRLAARSYVTSSGTLNNCAGGATPWGTWITCEEARDTGHGYAFEVDPREPEDARSAEPIRAMGYFSHEAIDVDPWTGIAYLTEDDFRGPQVPPEREVPGTTRSSFLFRYLPDNRAARPGALQEGGRLQVMAVDQRRACNMDLGHTGERFRVVWLDVDPQEPHPDAIAKGAAGFQRLEGCHFAGGAFWFDDTSGGEKRHGQVFRLLPSRDPSGAGADRLELFLEGDSREQMDSPDNLTITPWADSWLAEDGADGNRLVGITPYGATYVFAVNRLNDSELCGPCFAPDGRTFFVNIQDPGHTYAVWGAFPPRDAYRRGAIGWAAPRHPWAPDIPEDLDEYAVKQGMTRYEAAAFDRLGVTLL